MIFNFYYDAGHGWLEVEKSLIKKLGLTKEISSYSYEKDDLAFLEEDCDAGKLIKILKEDDVEIEFNEVDHGDYSPIRSYNRFKGD